MFSCRPLALLLGASLMAGCAVGPDYKKPNVSLPERYLGQTQLEQRSAISNANLAAWWEGFGDPQLSRFVLLALDQNLDMAQASARIAQARSGLGSARAALLPSGNVSAQAAKNHQSLETPIGQLLNAVPGYDRDGSLYEANLTAAWELDIFGGLRRGQEAAVAEYQAAQAGGTATRLAVAAQTADLYITIRGLQARLGVARQQLETQQQLLSKVNMLYSKGLAPRLQVQQAEGAVAQVKATIPMLEAGLDSAMNALDVMLGVAPGTYRAEFGKAGPIPVAPQISSAGSPADLLRRRPDLIVAERRLAAANAKIGAATAEYYPKLALSVLLGSASAISGGNLLSAGANQAAGVLGLRWRLFDFSRINAQIDLAKGQEAEALAAYRQAALRATEDVENSISALVKREEQAIILLQGEQSLSQARDSSFAAYQKGVVSLIEVLHADENLLRTSDAKVQAQIESARSAVAAFKALGGGWEGSNGISQSSNALTTAVPAEN
ncbi:MAG: efflux transporter outer membrane subunit [Methylophilaceae bacterium]|jgi:NodT family efflux transporter outer membrane factor (OMF) lipoprotein|uniref:efflux transporter outer membrane subunit n=1 Tax=Methylobacillus sp. MM3 TaxID=1848039 RepID=UPI0007DEEA0A|nr:TolC family protein [Methylobacillus sp. MM3]OAJ69444.1 RND transporter [Methylobacillus sp. MM3]